MKMEEKIDIPEKLQQICRDFAEVAIKHGLYNLNGSFSARDISPWRGDINFGWSAGRHNEDSNQLRISSTFNVFTTVNTKKDV